jgi:cytochrome P450
MPTDQLVEMEMPAIPMAEDRGRGWSTVRDAGRAVRVNGVLWLTHREDVEFVLRHPELFSSKQAFDSLGSPLPLVPISFDPPEHTRFRKILQPFFSPRALAGLLPSLQAQSVELVSGLAARGRCDVVRDLATPYPSQVFLTLFGLPLEDRDRLIGWKDSVIVLSGQGASAMESGDLGPAMELFAYLTDYIGRKRQAPGEDILSQLLCGPEPLDDQEAIGLSFLFVLAGLDTVTAAIGFAFQRLAADPALRRHVMGDPDRLQTFIEEVVRLEPPAPMVPRVTTQEVAVAGTVLPAGTLVYACVGSANRDADPDPDDDRPGDELDADGALRRHWGFGGGPHRCLGSHLARLELKLVLTEWHRRIPDYTLEPGARPRITWPDQTFALTALPLTYPAVG